MFGFQIKLAIRYLWGRKLRSILTTLAIVFGTLVIFGTNLLVPTMMEAFEMNMLAASGQVDITISEKSGETFRSNILNRLRTVEGIRAMSATLSRTINIPEEYYEDSKVTALTLTGIDVHSCQTLRNYSISEGRFLRSSDNKAAVISGSLAENLGVVLGDELRLPTTDGSVELKIVGLLPARSLPGNEVVYVPLYEAQKLLDRPDRINTIEINLETMDEKRREEIKHQIEMLIGDSYTLEALGSGSEILASMQVGRIAFSLFGFLAMFMGGFIIYNTFRTIVAERRHDIGMLRAIGASRRTIIWAILTEGFLQGVVGTFTGIFFGYLLGAGLLLLMGKTFTQYLHMEIGAPVVTPALILITIIFGVGVSIVAALLPAYRASKITPIEALRPSMAEVSQEVVSRRTFIGCGLVFLSFIGLLTGNIGLSALGGLCLLAGLVMISPAFVSPISKAFNKVAFRIVAQDGTGKLASNNMERQPSRAAITASTTMVALAIIIGLGGLVWSMSGGFMDILRRSLGSDYLIMPPSVGIWKSNIGAKQELSQRLSSVPGVEVVSSMRYVSASARGQALSLLGIEPRIFPQVASLTFQEGDSQTAFAALENERALIINGMLASQMGLQVGDVLQLSTPTGQKDYQVVAIAGDFFNAKILTAYTSHQNLQNDFRKSEDIFYQLNLYPGADSALVEERLEKILEDYDQFTLISGKGYFEETEQMFGAIFAVYFVLLTVLAFPSLMAMLNTLSIGIIERTREIGMLRAIGATQKQVRRMVVAESLLLAAFGTLLGIVAGLYLGYVMVLGLSVSGFPVQYAFPTGGIVAAVIVGILFGFAAAIMPANQAARMEIVRALRYE